MIWVTRINGSEIVVNADLIETVESTHDTVITLADGTKYLVAESAAEIVDRVRLYRASVLAAVDQLTRQPPTQGALYVLPVDEDGS